MTTGRLDLVPNCERNVLLLTHTDLVEFDLIERLHEDVHTSHGSEEWYDPE